MIIMKIVIIVIITIMITIIHSLFTIITNIIYKNYDKIVKKSKNTLKCLIKI